MEDLPELRTARLLLRPFHSGDVDDVFAYASDPEWGRFLPVPDPYTRHDAEKFVAGCILVDGKTRFEWAIVHEGQVSGGISLRVHASGSAEMGYSIARPLWGQGLTTEAAQAVIAHGFEALGLARIQAAADIRNEASWRVMEKLGMERTGVAHSERLLRGERIDSVFYEVLAEEWSPPPPTEDQERTDDHAELHTERLLLRPYRLDDVGDVLDYATDPEWARFLDVPDPYVRRSAEDFIATAIVAERATNAMWAIVHEGKVCGGIALTVHDPGSAEVGYSIARPLWGQGLTTEAAQAVIAYGFEELALTRIHAYADVRNAASWRVMEKLGMQREGLLRSNHLIHDERTDDVIYAILREEWSPPGPGGD